MAFDFSTSVTPTSVSDSRGNVFAPVGNQLTSPAGARSRLYYAKNIKGGADTVTVTFSANSSWIELYLTEYSGVDPNIPIDAQAGATGAAGPVSSGPAITTLAGDLIYGYCVGDWVCTVGSGFAARSTLNGNLAEDKLAGSPGSYAATGSANNGWSMQMVALRAASGAGTAPNVILSPASITFPSEPIGSVAPVQTITVSNSGSAALNISSIAITGVSINDFSQTNNCGASLAAGSSCSISVTFKPTASGTRSAGVTLTDNAAGSPQSASLSGTGSAVPAANVSPASLTFPSELIGNAAPAQVISLSNTGSAALSISSIAITGVSINDFSQTNNCGASLAAGSSCSISVTFKPTASGTRSASVTLTDNAAGSPQTVSLSGTGAGAPTASLSPASLTFPSEPIGNPAPAQNITVSNSGSGALTISAIAITGVSLNDFSQTNNCGTSLAAGSSCSISVTFKPTASGTRSAGVTLTDNAAGSPQSASLSGTGSAVPAANISPGSLTFASQPMGSSAAAQTITLSNPGSAALSISGIVLTGTNSGDFAQSSSCGTSLAAGSTCTIIVTFTPTATGARSAAITLTDNAAGSPQTVSLTGTGTAPSASLSPTGLAFASEPIGNSTAAQSITLSNAGNAALSISSIAFAGANSTDFAQTNTCGSSVAAGGNCTISVTFTPTASGARSAALTVTDNAAGSPQTVSLSGTGAGAPTASLSPASLTFPSEPIGTAAPAQVISLSNPGGAALSISSIAITGVSINDFSQTNNCGTSLAAGSTCTISVTFTPTASGARSAGVTLTDNAAGSPQTVSLAGTGTTSSSTVSLSSNTLAFGNQPVDMNSASQTVTLTNTGTTTLNITSIALAGANASDFGQANTCNSSVAAGGTCTIAILFTPSASGSRSAALTIADSATGSPQTVALSGTGTHDVMLTWTPGGATGIAGYNVYRGTTAGGESTTPLNSSPVSGAAFVDENVQAGQQYYYVVAGVDSNGNPLTPDSNEASATVPTP